ncbi:unnamed protein product [Owenia fusiformis]|uniref:G-protein coupled receptors family 1 profile domain-containing protein n=1 Tax=Owenia fusiformis TaxID=6347 RepID=A0A8S4Q7A2_OWEFU|nr:unnamed protein product [Owenia fusiformis]
MTGWILVLVTCERVVFIFWPMRAKMLCQRKVAGMILTMLCVVLIGLNSHIFWTFSLHKEEDGFMYCDWLLNIDDVTFHDFDIFWTWTDLCLATLFPFFIMLACDIAIISRLFDAERNRQIVTSITKPRTKKSNTKSVAIMLVSISFTFLVLTLPVLICIVLTESEVFDRDGPAHEKLEIAKHFCTFVQQFNSVINFWMYCFTGTTFRQELKQMLKASCFRHLIYFRKLSAQTGNSGMSSSSAYPWLKHAENRLSHPNDVNEGQQAHSLMEYEMAADPIAHGSTKLLSISHPCIKKEMKSYSMV